ncbi:MAG: nucleotidyl transferase AbiEii/AbiGii toxin family protein [Thermodesulfobacteriota bacterium]|nr:nucleotidyl transferase AbiEii/AbiGii toxin family protein [Thermodesulfobacteriota bacterium]
MNEAVARMMSRYKCRRLEDYVRALREILQEIALLGLWRSKFYEKSAFYGGTALRILYGLDRFSEDLDFSLLQPIFNFDLSRYSKALQTEMRSFGFEVTVHSKKKQTSKAGQSAFLKVNTVEQLIIIDAEKEIIRGLPQGQVLKIKLEVDTDPPPGFETEVKYLLHPIPFSVRSYVLPDLFAGKMHAILCRRWKNRIKGRDWYDFVWFVTNHPELHLSHLEKRMIQTGDWKQNETLTEERFYDRLRETIEMVDLKKARVEVEPFVNNPDVLAIWSEKFFMDISRRIVTI